MSFLPHLAHLKVQERQGSEPQGLPECGLCQPPQHYCPQLSGSQTHRVRPQLPVLTATWKPLHTSKPHQASPLLWNCPNPTLSGLALSRPSHNLPAPYAGVPTPGPSEGPNSRVSLNHGMHFLKNAAPRASLQGFWLTSLGWGPGKPHA